MFATSRGGARAAKLPTPQAGRRFFIAGSITVQFAAIVERRLVHRYVYLPTLGSGGIVPGPDDVQRYATGLVTEATGRAAADVQISVRPAVQADTSLRVPPTEVETRHAAGVPAPRACGGSFTADEPLPASTA